MANTGHSGIDLLQTANRLIFDAFLQDSAGNLVTSGTTSLYIYEVQDDGTLKSYDFSSNTFKTTALTTETASMTHRTGNNSTTNTGLWTYALSTLSGFTVGAKYYARIVNSGASPVTGEMRAFQFGGAEGDMVVTAGALDANVTALNGVAAAAVKLAVAAGVMRTGTVESAGHTPTTTEFEASDITEATADHYKDRTILFTSGALTEQQCTISAYSLVSGRGHFTVSTLTEAPADNDTFIIV